MNEGESPNVFFGARERQAEIDRYRDLCEAYKIIIEALEEPLKTELLSFQVSDEQLSAYVDIPIDEYEEFIENMSVSSTDYERVAVLYRALEEKVKNLTE